MLFTMRNDIGFLITLLLMGADAEGGGAPRILPPFLRGGSSATKTKRKTEKLDHPIHVVADNAKRGLGKAGIRMRRDASNAGRGVGRECARLGLAARKLAGSVPRPPWPRPPLRRNRTKSCKRLDEDCRAFSSVLRVDGVDTARLLRACRAHLAVMKSGGPSLRLVARDLESNVRKAERAFKKCPEGGTRLSSLLGSERDKGVHDGDRLHEDSAAMGLLWIRRSLAFQRDLYASLANKGGDHPKDAARVAYERHLAPYHGWALRRVFPASLSQMPGRDAFVAKFGGIPAEELDDERDREVSKKLKALVSTWDPLIHSWEAEFERLGLEDTRRV